MNAQFSLCSTGLCFYVSMMKHIMSLRVAAVALAASALTATPAAADPVREAIEKAAAEAEHNAGGRDEHRRRDSDDEWRRDRDDDGRYGDDRRRPHLNRFGQTYREAERLRRDAVSACSYSVDRVAWRGRFQTVSSDDRRNIHQYNRDGITVRFDDVEFRTRYGFEERTITCVFDRGEVVRLDGLPHRERPGRARSW